MFVLDTNVLAAVMGSQPVPAVAAWVAAQSEDQLFATTVCQAEILAGIEIMREGRRRRGLAAAATAIFANAFDGRILPFDAKSAESYAEIFAASRWAGKPTATMDLMIASIAHAQGATIVTRNVGVFHGCGVTVINPREA